MTIQGFGILNGQMVFYHYCVISRREDNKDTGAEIERGE